MNELGFFMDQEGNIRFFGEWAENKKIDKTNRHQLHKTSFADEIENTPYFKSLNLHTNQDQDFFEKAIDYSQQGAIIGMNFSSTTPNELMMLFTAPELTEPQKASIISFYPLLKSFFNINIVGLKPDCMNDEPLTNIDEFFKISVYNNSKPMVAVKHM